MSNNLQKTSPIVCVGCKRCADCLKKLLNTGNVKATLGNPPTATRGNPSLAPTKNYYCCPIQEGRQAPVAKCYTCSRVIDRYGPGSIINEIDSILSGGNPSSTWTLVSHPTEERSQQCSEMHRFNHSDPVEQSCIYAEGDGVGELNISPRRK